MTTHNFDKDTKIAVIGDIHGHDEQFFKIVEKFKPGPNRILISAGDVLDKGWGETVEFKIIHEMQRLESEKCFFMVKGNHEVKRIKKLKKFTNLATEYLWLNSKRTGLSFTMPDFKLTVVHAGVTPKHSEKDFENNSLDFCYTRTVDSNGNYIPLIWKDNKLIAKADGVLWHEIYDGRFGYIASGHIVQEDGMPKFYDNSCNLDSGCYETGIMSAQVFGNNGLEDLIQATGKYTGWEEPE